MANFISEFFQIRIHNLKTSNKTRLRYVLGFIAIILVLIFILVQFIRGMISISNPKYTMQYTRPADGFAWFPQIAICPGIFDNVTTDGHHDAFIVGTIKNLNCSWIEERKDEQTGKISRTYYPVPHQTKQYTVFDREYPCYVVNYDWNETPGSNFRTREDHFSCSMDSNTNIRVSAFRHTLPGEQQEQRPSTRFDEWTNVERYTAHALSARASYWQTVTGSNAFGPFFEIWQNMVIYRYSWRDDQKATRFRMYMNNFFEQRHIQYYDVDFYSIVISILVVCVFVKQGFDVCLDVVSSRFSLKEAAPLFAKEEGEASS